MSAAPGDAGETPEPNSTEEVSSSAADQHPAPESAEPVAALVPEAPVADAEVVPAPEPEPEATPEPEAAPESEPAAVEPAPEPELEPVAAAPAAEPEPVAAAPVSSMPAEPEAEPVDASDAALFEAALSALDSPDQMDSGLKRLTKGERIEATVIQVERDRVFVDLGTKSEGIVPIGELTDDNIGHASEHVKVGDKIDVIVLKTESGDGNPIVSKKRADFENAWLKIEEAFAKQTPINAPVIDRVKGGLVVDIGVRGFVPATHVGTGKLRNIDKYVGQTLECRILELDRERRKVVLSNRQAEEERRGRAKEELFDTAKPGDILSGTVRRLTDYGAFVDLGGVDGLLHISEMSWMRITHPREMFKEGQDIQVMVLRLDKDHGKISLGHRQVLPDPWNLVRENYRPNQKLTVTINRIVQAGAFVKLPEGAEAFLPLSEMSSRRLKKPQEAVSEGQEVEVQIIDLKPEDRRMVLSMRAIGGGPSMPMPQATFGDDDRDSRRLGAAGKRGKKVKGGRRQEDEDFEDYAIGRRSFGGGGGVTIGERLGMLKGFGTREDEETPEDAEAPAAASEAPEAPEAPAAESESE
ncbi:MAG: 30S ribosomal protein S1 [Armatimonadetes bacterium]|nr:30S ribosomal protein S1 [Armatimonadota bacterium]